jgi:predicted amidohydrolase YtcJ
MLEQSPSTGTDTPSVILRGGRVGFRGQPGDVVIADGRVAEITAMGAARGGEVLDLADTTVLPGLVDSHVHLDQWAHCTRRIDVSGAPSALAVAETIRRRLDDSPTLRTARVVTAHGYVDGLWDVPAHKQVLDSVLGDLPVAVVSADLHALWLNSAALTVVGQHGHPTGVLRERDSFNAVAVLTAAEPVELVDRWVAEATAAAAARGVTALVDFEFADNLAVWQRRVAQYDIAVRVHATIWLPWLDSAVATGLRTGDILQGTRGLIQVGPFKLMADGSLNTRTAYCHEPYPGLTPGDPDAYGMELIPADELVELMTRAWAAGLEPAVHAIGDHANSTVLSAFEKVGCRGRIEHAQLILEEDISRYAACGVTASVQPQHAVADRDVAERQWPGRTGRAFPYRALHDAGVRLTFGSDAPVSPLDPWLAIADAVARTDDARPAWHPEQALPLEVALTAACGGRAGLAVGDVADLTVVPGDLAGLTPDELRRQPVAATMVGGVFTHLDR